MTDWQAAIGSAQMDKLSGFCEKRKQHFAKYIQMLGKYERFFILPEATENADPAWFSFIVTLRENLPFTRDQLTRFLNDRKIETRNLFAGNITKQPAFIHKNYRVAGSLDHTDYIMNNTFFLGTYPGLTPEMFDYTAEIFDQFLAEFQ
jgi:CDP-6-deoxy-D-xylo-4-hexulose-3-dehydrase